MLRLLTKRGQFQTVLPSLPTYFHTSFTLPWLLREKVHYKAYHKKGGKSGHFENGGGGDVCCLLTKDFCLCFKNFSIVEISFTGPVVDSLKLLATLPPDISGGTSRVSFEFGLLFQFLGGKVRLSSCKKLDHPEISQKDNKT